MEETAETQLTAVEDKVTKEKAAETEELDPTEAEEKVEICYAMEMLPGKLYITYQSRARYFCKLVVIDEKRDCVELMAYYPQSGAWKQPKVPMRYKLRVLTAEEQQVALSEIEKTSHNVREIFNTYSAPKKRDGGERPEGTSGRGMLEAWGFYFKEFAHQPEQREKIRAAMKAEFVTKHESIDRWIDAYRNYYNKGRLPGVTVPAVEIAKDEWLT